MITYKSFFFIGIKGVMMSNCAVILKKMGFQVTGADAEEEFITDKILKENKINYLIGFNNLPENIDCVVYSAAHGGLNNLLIIEAKKRNIQVIAQTKLLGELMADFKISIAVSGCHGKTTTSSLLSHALIKLNAKPSYCVGVPYFGTTQGSDYQGKDYFVVEADEYGVNPPVDKTPKFNFLDPDYIICTNIDFDHPDVYKDLEDTKNTFLTFFKRIINKSIIKKPLVLCIDDLNTYQSINRFIQDRCVTYGTNNKADYRIINIKTIDSGTTFELIHKSKNVFTIPLFGDKNVLNATAVIIMLLQLGFKPDEIQKSIAGFQGAERRMQKIYEGNEIQLLDDYAHHPNEIRATIEAARKRFPENRLIIIFQPHTYSRTQALLKEFSFSLSKADIVYILPIFASARENKEHFSVTSEDITKQSSKSNLTPVKNKVQSIKLLSQEIKSGDIIITMGAGDVYKLKDDIIKLISNS